MLGEVLTPSPAPAHWDNFCRTLPVHSVHPASSARPKRSSINTSNLCGIGFATIGKAIGRAEATPLASISSTINCETSRQQIGVLHLLHLFLVTCDLAELLLIHTTRNVIHCAISTLIASQRNVWHNYDGAVIDRSYHLDIEECLAHARTILQHRDAFLESASGCKVVNCRYESLIDDIARAGSQEEIPEAPGAFTGHRASTRKFFQISLRQTSSEGNKYPIFQIALEL